MATKSNPVVLGTTNTVIYEAPATFGAVVQLFVSNKNASGRTYTISQFVQRTGLTTVLTPAISIAALAAPTKGPLAFSLEPGDIIYGAASAVDSVVVVPFIDLSRSTAAKGMTPRGVYAAGTTYAINDVANVVADGITYLSLQDGNLGNTPSSSPSFWMVLAAQGEDGAAGTAGSGAEAVVRVVAYGNINYATELENGDTQDGVVLQTNDLALLVMTASPERSGIYVVQASGAASRHADFDTYDEHCGRTVSVMEGAAYADTRWICTSNKGGTLNTTALAFRLFPDAKTATDVAPAATIDLNAVAGNLFDFTTGTTTVTAVTLAEGRRKVGRATSAFILTNNAAIIVQGGANYTTVAGDLIEFFGYAAGVVRVRIARINDSGVGSVQPQGRLTLVTGTPVMVSSQAAKNTVYYAPFRGNVAPIYDGVNFISTVFAELSQLTTDTSKSPAISPNVNYDMLLWNDAGTIRCTRGYGWTTGGGSDVARGTGAGSSELERINGRLVNKHAVTNGPAAQRGTYVGTIRSNNSSLVDHIFGGTADGGTAGVFGVYNEYNQIKTQTTVIDSANSWTVAAGTVQAKNAGGTGSGLNNRVSFLVGMQRNSAAARIVVLGVSGAASSAGTAVGFNSISAIGGASSVYLAGFGGTISAENAQQPLGWNFFQALDVCGGATNACSFYGDNGVPTFFNSGMTVELWH